MKKAANFKTLLVAMTLLTGNIALSLDFDIPSNFYPEQTALNTNIVEFKTNKNNIVNIFEKSSTSNIIENDDNIICDNIIVYNIAKNNFYPSENNLLSNFYPIENYQFKNNIICENNKNSFYDFSSFSPRKNILNPTIASSNGASLFKETKKEEPKKQAETLALIKEVEFLETAALNVYGVTYLSPEKDSSPIKAVEATINKEFMPVSPSAISKNAYYHSVDFNDYKVEKNVKILTTQAPKNKNAETAQKAY
ncbi:MAG: hypothetical protein PHV37_01445 [Candidatus Gastranaerophilales bacterium]|nr:hypothetical protein [Candidatus Gastranaerophilales bacterium]